MSNRYDLTGDEFSRALNEIFIVFSDSSLVMSSLEKHHKAVTSPGGDSEDETLVLLKSMCKEVGVNYKDFNDSFYLRPYNTKPASQRP